MDLEKSFSKADNHPEYATLHVSSQEKTFRWHNEQSKRRRLYIDKKFGKQTSIIGPEYKYKGGKKGLGQVNVQSKDEVSKFRSGRKNRSDEERRFVKKEAKKLELKKENQRKHNQKIQEISRKRCEKDIDEAFSFSTNNPHSCHSPMLARRAPKRDFRFTIDRDKPKVVKIKPYRII